MHDSYGHASNGNGSNGHGSNGHGSNGHGSNGHGSNGSVQDAPSITGLMRSGHATIDLRDDSSRLLSLPFQAAARQIVRVDKVSLVIPTLNEGRNIGFVLEHVPDRVDEIIIVDGHSTDDTVAAARAVRPDVVIVQQVGAGKGSALRAGFAAASGDIIVMMDADGSMDPAEILSYVYAIEAGYEFVKGSRAIKGGGSEDLTMVRRFGNFALTTAVNMLFLVPFSDLCYGFVAFRKDRLDDLALMSRGFEFETEIAIRAIKVGLRIAEVPSNESNRRFGTSNLNAFRDGKRVLRTIIRERLVSRPRPVVDCFRPEDFAPNVTALSAKA
jgi:glycosyltransferase involved in cell wall biosynthesis